MSTQYNLPTDSSLPGEAFEVRQQNTTDDWEPNPSKSIPLAPNRQALIDDIIALYSCQPTVERVKRYTADCVYDDQFVYANDRHKMAGQWFALPKGFKESKNEAYQVIVNDPGLIQFLNKQTWVFAITGTTVTINALVSLSLDPDSAESDFVQVKYHKDQANQRDYSHSGAGFAFKKFQADNAMKWMNNPDVQTFAVDGRKDNHADIRKYKDGLDQTEKLDVKPDDA